jgi:hypothetical protein
MAAAVTANVLAGVGAAARAQRRSWSSAAQQLELGGTAARAGYHMIPSLSDSATISA